MVRVSLLSTREKNVTRARTAHRAVNTVTAPAGSAGGAHRDRLLCSKGATIVIMRRTITQRELRNDSGKIMRALDKGASFVITRNGVPVGELIPIRRRTFIPASAAVAAFARAARVDFRRLRKDLDAVVNQDPGPHGR
jgi:prevent-host-death family protein